MDFRRRYAPPDERVRYLRYATLRYREAARRWWHAAPVHVITFRFRAARIGQRSYESDGYGQIRESVFA